MRSLHGLSYLLLASVLVAAPAWGQECDRAQGTVVHGEAFRARLLTDFEVLLDPVVPPQNPQGWTIRVMRPPDEERDLSVFATPPFRSSNPRYIDTGYGLTAEQAVSWSVREFGFATGPTDHDTLATAVRALLWPHDYAEETLEQARRTRETVPVGSGTLRILDADTRPPDERYPGGLIARLEFEVELCLPDDSGRDR